MANKVLLKKSSVASKVPLTTDLDYGELALNYADGKLYFKNSSNIISSFSNYDLSSPPAIGNSVSNSGAFTTLSASSTVTLSGGTANGVLYLDSNKIVTSGSALSFDGSTFGLNAVGGGAINNTTANLFIQAPIAGGAGFIFRDTSAGSYAEYMRLTSTGLGIGTSSPSARLHVLNSSGVTLTLEKSSGAALQFVNSGGNGYQIDDSNGSMRWLSSGSTERMRLDSSGNLGLGVTPSAWDTSYNAFQISWAALAGNTGSMNIGHNWYYNAGLKYIGAGSATNYYQYNGSHVWQTSTSGTAGSAISFNQAMTLDASGNLGINNSIPTEKLDIGGRLKFSQFSSDVNDYAIYVVNGVGLTLSSYTSLAFRTTGSERMRIDASGNVGIGTTSPLAKLDSRGNILIGTNANGDNIIGFGNTSVLGGSLSGAPSSMYGNSFIVGTSSTGSGAPGYLSFWTTSNGTVYERLRITSSGDVGIGTSSPSAKLDAITYSGDGIKSTATTGLPLILNNGAVNSNPTLMEFEQQGYSYWRMGVPNASDAFAIYGYGSGAFPERMRIDSAGNVGIGTSSPNEKLMVNGAIRSTSNANNWTASAGAIMDYYPAGTMARFVASDGTNSGQLYLTTSGNLGLGVTPSAWFTSSGYNAMQLRNASLYFRNSAAELYIGNNNYYNGTNWIYLQSLAAARYDLTNGIHSWYTAPSGTSGNAISFTQAMTLDASGNLLVGTTTNTNNSKVVVNGVIESTTGGIKFPDGTTQTTASAASTSVGTALAMSLIFGG